MVMSISESDIRNGGVPQDSEQPVGLIQIQLPIITPTNTFPILVMSKIETDGTGSPLPLQQGTDEWHLWRSGGFYGESDLGGIGGSDVSTIMGVNPWDNAVDLWRRRKGLLPPKSVTPAMLVGTEREPIARCELMLETGLHLEPKCFQHPTLDWVRVSLDGVTDDHRVLAEIKCPGNYTHSEALKGRVPKHYVPQVQYQMFATGIEWCYYYSYTPELGGKRLEVERDEEYIARMIERVQLFREFLLGDIEPPLELFKCGDIGSDKDRADPAWRKAAEAWRKAMGFYRDAQLQLQSAEIEIERLMQRKKQGVASGAGICAERYVDADTQEWRLRVVEEGE